MINGDYLAGLNLHLKKKKEGRGLEVSVVFNKFKKKRLHLSGGGQILIPN